MIKTTLLTLSVAFGLGLAVGWSGKQLLSSLNQAQLTIDKTNSHTLNHLAIIMDGNRRWAKKHSLMPWLGHKEGVNAIKESVTFCVEHKIPMLSLYAFSLENFKRSEKELEYLFNVMVEEGTKLHAELVEKKVRVRFLGDRRRFPAKVLPIIKQLEQDTATGDKLTVNLLFCYGGRQEIIDGVKTMVSKIKAGTLTEAAIDEQTFDTCLWTAGVPQPDLIIRTGGAQRLSNFFLYQAGYSELYFTDTYWPDITKKELTQALSYFQQTRRLFGS